MRLTPPARPSGDAARGLSVAIVAARFNADLVDRMVAGATAAWARQGGDPQRLLLVHAPGAFELPLLARRLAASGRHDAIVTLGCVIRGETAHFDFVAGEAARGIAEAARDTGVPVIFGVLTTENAGQALERADPARMDKGGEAMDAALEMARVLRALGAP
ncbi:MAG TPA: 6,7-dimethyl-8-ribityllumazine synthase [Steroidobacteraceae bacterium]|nr:6,7-dimethyl-8-ribityllumazine synthase [Steroidobacteraceae bacterium]